MSGFPRFSHGLVAMLCLAYPSRRRGRGRVQRSAEESPSSPELEAVEPSWLDKMRRACQLQRLDVVARIALSLKDMETAMELVHALAFECLKYRARFLKTVLKEFRLRNVSPELGVELFRCTELWFRSHQPREIEWNEVLYALVLAGHYEEAWALVTSMEDGSDPRMPAPTQAIYSVLLLPVALNEGPRVAAQLLLRARHRMGIDPVPHLIMAVIYVRERRLDMAKMHVRQGERLWRQLRTSSEPYGEKEFIMSSLYATLMAAYRRLGRVQDCFTLLGVMQQHAVQPTRVAFSILQQACWGHLDATGEVRQILRLMEDMKVTPDTCNYNALIRTYSDAGQFTNALQVANRLREAGVPWDEFTYTYLLFAAVGAGQVELGVRLLSQMRSDGVRPTAKQYITVFLGLAQAGYYEDATRVFERLVSLGSCTTQAFNVMIGIHCQRAAMTAAMETMERMKEAGMGPDVLSWLIVLTGYAMAGQFDEISQLQSTISAFRSNLQQLAVKPSATSTARSIAKNQLEQRERWSKVYDLLIDAALWNDEWSRAVGLLKDLIDLGCPVDVQKRWRLIQDLKAFYPSSDPGDPGVAALVEPQEQLSLVEQGSPSNQRRRKWLAKVPSTGAIPAAAGIPEAAVLDHVSLHALAASFSPHWLSGGANMEIEPVWEQCRRMLREEASDALDASTAYGILHAYYHATIHRRSVVPFQLKPGQTVHLRSSVESISSLRQLFELHGWPTGDPDSPRYVFLRPNGFTLDAFLLLLSLAAAYPHSVIFLREALAAADQQQSEPEGEEAAETVPLTKQSLQRAWSRALTVTLGASIRSFPAALLVNSRTLLATADLTVSCSVFEKKLRDALAGRDQAEEEEDMRPTEEAWDTWLRRQGLRRLLRHDSRGFLRSDGLAARPARLETREFQLKGMANGEVDVEL